LIADYANCTINIIRYADDEWGVKTRTVAYSGISARIEEQQKYVKNQDGVDVLANTLIMFETDSTIQWNDKIQIVTRDGSAASLPSKEFAVKGIEIGSEFISHHWEVWL
jgi:hypothetical protein